MEELNMALCSIPFNERNSIEEANFSQTDILTMNNRATRFKQKYYNEKSYSALDTEAQNIINNLRDGESTKEENVEREKDTSHDIELKYDKDRKTSETENVSDINLSFKSEIKTRDEPVFVAEENVPKEEAVIDKIKATDAPNILKEVEHDDFVFGDTSKHTVVDKVLTPNPIDKPLCHIENTPRVDKLTSVVTAKVPDVVPAPAVSKGKAN